MLSKNQQYGLLLVLYLTRSGTAYLQDICANLDLDIVTLMDVAYKLEKEGFLSSDENGYMLIKEVTLKDILKATGPLKMLSPEVRDKYLISGLEGRALAAIATALDLLIYERLKDTPAHVIEDMVTFENIQLEAPLEVEN